MKLYARETIRDIVRTAIKYHTERGEKYWPGTEKIIADAFPHESIVPKRDIDWLVEKMQFYRMKAP